MAGAGLEKTAANLSESTYGYAHNAQTFLQFFALEEISRYEPIALLNWRRRSQCHGGAHETHETKNSSEHSDDSAWLTFMLASSPMILAAHDSQVKANDFLAYFVNQCLLQFLSP